VIFQSEGKNEPVRGPDKLRTVVTPEELVVSFAVSRSVE